MGAMGDYDRAAGDSECIHHPHAACAGRPWQPSDSASAGPGGAWQAGRPSREDGPTTRPCRSRFNVELLSLRGRGPVRLSALIRCQRRPAGASGSSGTGQALGLSQKESATRLGVDPGTLSRWERGATRPSGILLARVSRLLEGGEESAARRTG
jgi:DNA-binding XRE family transcriptional regulator